MKNWTVIGAELLGLHSCIDRVPRCDAVFALGLFLEWKRVTRGFDKDHVETVIREEKRMGHWYDPYTWLDLE